MRKVRCRAPVAVISGISSGIGLATAQKLRRAGWVVEGIDLSATGDVSAGDVASLDTVTEFGKEVMARRDRIDALISCAGHYRRERFLDITGPVAERMVDVHLGGCFNLCRTFLPAMYDVRAGAVAIVASELGIGGGEFVSHYAAAKGALIGFARSLAREAAVYGVRVNVVAPGPTDTPLIPEGSSERNQGALNALPLRRLVTAEEVAACIEYLVMVDKYMVGEVLSPNAGAVI